MHMTLKDDIRLTRDFPNLGVQAFLVIGRAFWELLEHPARIVREHGITPTQHNVLRILRGTPEGMSHRDIRERMVANESDVSRILDKLVRDGFAKRVRSKEDKRVVFGQITPKGLKLCSKLEAPLHAIHEAQFERLGRAKTKQLIQLLEELRKSNQED